MTNILNHNKSDFATEEEYKEQVSADLDQALADNNLNVDEETKKVEEWVKSIRASMR